MDTPVLSTVKPNQPGANSALEQSLFMRACRRESVERTPIWLMRQAGRFQPEYREIRSKVGFLELCKNSQLSAEVTVMAQQMLQVDAAIIFADILLPLEPMGVGLEYVKGDGPNIKRPVREAVDVDKLLPVNPQESLSYVLDSIKYARRDLPGDIPLLGFAGAPFTMASYLIEGGASRHFENTKAFMYKEPVAWQKLMRILALMTAEYLNAQIQAGAQAVQIFDSWVGCLSDDDYRQFVLPYSQLLISKVNASAPLIHFGTGTAHLLELMRQAGGQVIGLDWRVNLQNAWSRLGHDVAIQGNLDPTVLLAEPAEIRARATAILRQANARPGHIFNLGHGVLPQTSVANVKVLVDCVKELGAISE